MFCDAEKFRKSQQKKTGLNAIRVGGDEHENYSDYDGSGAFKCDMCK